MDAIDPTTLTAWATVVLVFATVVLAAITAWLAHEQRMTRRDAIAPDVVVTIEPAHITILKVCIQNIGRGAARNVSVRSTPPMLYQLDNETELDLTKTKSLNPSFLKPGQKIERWLGYFGNLADKSYEIEVVYYNVSGRRYEQKYSIEIEMYNSSQFNKDSLSDIAKGIESLTKAVTDAGSRFRPLYVNTFNPEDRAAEDAAERQWLNDVTSKADNR
jgi:hypothetical protein